MWQRFTERARRVVFFAQQEAQKFQQSYVSPEHILLGMLREPDSASCRVILAAGVSLEQVQDTLTPLLPQGTGTAPTDMQLTPDAKRIMDLCYEEAKLLNNNYIGTEHMLLGLLRLEHTVAYKVLNESGLAYDTTFEAIRKQQEEATSDVPDSPESTIEKTIEKSGRMAHVQEAIQRLREQGFAVPAAFPDSATSQQASETSATAGKPQPGDLGTLQSRRGHGNVEVVLAEDALAEYIQVITARDGYGYTQLLESGKMLVTAVGTEIKVLVPAQKEVRSTTEVLEEAQARKRMFHLVRLLSGPLAGQKGYIAVWDFQYTGPDTRPFPPS